MELNESQRSDPVLAGPKGYVEDGRRYRIVVHGGLNYLRGNSAPYFSLTGEIERRAGNNHWYEWEAA